jgi:DNA-binding transcriptional LysR family regulator
MELHHLEYFLAVAEERNFTRAADRVHVVQSAVSAAVKSLEHELDSRLLERTPKRVVVTDAGRALLPKARATLDAARDARDAVDQVRGGLSGTLRIGTMTSVNVVNIPVLLGNYHQSHPGVDLQLTVAAEGSRRLAEGVADGDYDLALVALPGAPPAGVTIHELTSMRLHLVVSADHPIARRDRTSITRLGSETFIDFPSGWGNRTVTDRAFDSAGITRRVALEIANIAEGAEYVRQGLGIVFLPEFVLPDRNGLAVVPVAGADLRLPVSLATPSGRTLSAAARALIEMIVPPNQVDASRSG